MNICDLVSCVSVRQYPKVPRGKGFEQKQRCVGGRPCVMMPQAGTELFANLREKLGPEWTNERIRQEIAGVLVCNYAPLEGTFHKASRL